MWVHIIPGSTLYAEKYSNFTVTSLPTERLAAKDTFPFPSPSPCTLTTQRLAHDGVRDADLTLKYRNSTSNKKNTGAKWEKRHWRWTKERTHGGSLPLGFWGV